MNDARALVEEAFAAFKEEFDSVPPMTLRAGNAVDDCVEPPPYSPDQDAVTEAYLHQFRWGLGYLDARSWRHDLPHLIAHAIGNRPQGTDVTDALLQNLRPPDRGHLSALNQVQEQVIVKLLDWLAFSETSLHAAAAQTALEEWWGPGALYRPTST